MKSENPINWEWIGAATGILGAFLLATNTELSKFGWYFFLLANVALIKFAWDIKANGLLTQQFFFMATSLLGIYRVLG